MDVVKINQVSKHFYKFKAINSITLSIKEGKIYGLIGPNGAGKTTFVKLIIGAMFPTYGSIEVFNQKPGSELANKNIGYVCEKSALPFNQTAYRYLFTMGLLSGLNRKDVISQIDEYAGMFQIRQFLNKKLKTYSSGMKKKIQIISALFNNPKLLILDEPTENLDPNVRYEIVNFIKKLNETKKITVIYCTHNLYELEKMIHNIIFIKDGSLLIEGDYEEIKNNFRTRNRMKLKTSNDVKLMELLNTQFSIHVVSVSPLVIETSDLKPIKNFIFKYSLEHHIDIYEISESELTLYEIFVDYTRKVNV